MGNQGFQIKLLHPRYWLTWIGLGFWRLLVMLPYPVLLFLGRQLGKLMLRVGGERRMIAERNLALCFPDLSEEAREELLRKNFENYGIAFFEVGIGWWWSDKRFSRLIEFEGLEHAQALQRQGKGALLMAIHHTTLEIGGAAISKNHPADGMYRPHKNPVYDYVQAQGRRRRGGDTQVYERKDVRGILRALKKGRVIWYAPDQDYGPKQSVFGTFFGIPAASVTATARFAKMGNAAVLPFTHIRLPGSQGYLVSILPPLEDFPTGDDLADVETVNRVIEKLILRQPDQYMWVHRRFKTRPEGLEPIYPKRQRKRKKKKKRAPK